MQPYWSVRSLREGSVGCLYSWLCKCHRQALTPFMLSIFELHVHLLRCTIESSAWFQLKKSTCIASMLQQHSLQQSLLQNKVYIVSVAIHANAHKYMTSHHTHTGIQTQRCMSHITCMCTHMYMYYKHMNSIVVYSISYATCHLINMAA